MPENTVSFEEALDDLSAAPDAHTDAAVEIGLALKRARVAAKKTQSEVAASAGINQGALSDIERGRGKDGPSYRIVRDIAYAIGMEVGLKPHLEPHLELSGFAESPSAPFDMSDSARGLSDTFCTRLEKLEEDMIAEVAASGVTHIDMEAVKAAFEAANQLLHKELAKASNGESGSMPKRHA